MAGVWTPQCNTFVVPAGVTGQIEQMLVSFCALILLLRSSVTGVWSTVPLYWGKTPTLQQRLSVFWRGSNYQKQNLFMYPFRYIVLNRCEGSYHHQCTFGNVAVLLLLLNFFYLSCFSVVSNRKKQENIVFWFLRSPFHALNHFSSRSGCVKVPH